MGWSSWAGPAAIAAVSAVMALLHWRTWPDVLTDFGRELYVPWQLNEGRVLYRDLAYFNGPLSPYLNALWFRLFGTGLMSLAVPNLVLAGLLIVLLYRLLLRVGDRLSAASACIAFSMVFGFGNLAPAGNYNFVCPYAHEITHGLILAVLALWFASRYLFGGGMAHLAGAGLALGLALLTKAEVFLAGAVAVCAAWDLSLLRERPGWRAAFKRLLLFFTALLIPVMLAFCMLWTAMPAEGALRGILGPWSWIDNPDLTGLPYYRWITGTDNPGANLEKMMSCALAYGAIFLPALLLAAALRKAGPHRIGGAVACFMATAAGLGLVPGRGVWIDSLRPLPLWMLICAGATLLPCLRRGRVEGRGGREVLCFAMTLFALGLLAKIFLHTWGMHYGFALAMPATLVLVTALLQWIPSRIDRRGGYGHLFRAVALGALLAFLGGHLAVSIGVRDAKTCTVSRGPDAFRTGKKGPAVQELLDQIAQRMDPGDTLAVLPEGVMVNYLSRRANPTPYFNFMPPEMILFGETAMLAAFQARPPDYVALVHKSTAEYGYPFFGKDYGRRLYAWIGEHYRQVHQIGAPPLEDGRFGIALLERKGPR